jgi:hypothetical protein
MRGDANIDFSVYSDEDLRRTIATIDFVAYPANCRRLALELASRWDRPPAPPQVDSSLTGKGHYRFEDLGGIDRTGFFWRWFGCNLCVGIVYAILLTTVSICVDFVWVLATRVAGGASAHAVDKFQYAYLLSTLIFCVPASLYWLRWITRRSFGNFALRLIRTATQGVL